MNPRIIFVASLLVVLAIVAGCKKDYPKDIPKWLQEKIKEYKRGPYCMSISEYSKGDSTLYLIEGIRDARTLLDDAGNKICSYDGFAWDCNFNFYTTTHFVRHIWSDDYKKCY